MAKKKAKKPTLEDLFDATMAEWDLDRLTRLSPGELDLMGQACVALSNPFTGCVPRSPAVDPELERLLREEEAIELGCKIQGKSYVIFDDIYQAKPVTMKQLNAIWDKYAKPTDWTVATTPVPGCSCAGCKPEMASVSPF